MEKWKIITIAILAYAVIVAFIGYWAEKGEKKSKNLQDYYLGGRSIGPVLAVFAMTTTMLSSFALLGAPGFFYTHGTGSIGLMFTNFMAYLCTYLPFAFRFHYLGHKYGYITLGDFMADRFGNHMRIIVSVSALIITIPYIAIQIMGFGYVFEGATFGNVSWLTGALFLSGIMVFYIFMGGYKGVALTDAVQGIVMILALIIGGVYICNHLFGGIPETFRQIAAQSPKHLTTPGPKEYWNLNSWLTWAFIGIGVATQPQIIQKYLSVKDTKAIRFSLFVHPILSFIIYSGAMLLGLAAILALPGLSPKDADMSSMMLIGKYVPIGLGLIMIVGIVAAAMSTADSQYITLSSLFVRDLIQKGLYKHKELKAENMVKMGRIFVLILFVIGFAVAYLRLDTLIGMLTKTVYPLGAQMYITMLFGLYWRRANSKGATAGLLAGFIVALTTIFVVPVSISPIFLGMGVNILVTVVVSLLTPAPKQETIKRIHDFTDNIIYRQEDNEDSIDTDIDNTVVV